jgi:hypothetical protein
MKFCAQNSAKYCGILNKTPHGNPQEIPVFVTMPLKPSLYLLFSVVVDFTSQDNCVSRVI